MEVFNQHCLCQTDPTHLKRTKHRILKPRSVHLECGHSFCQYCINILHTIHQQNKCPRCIKPTTYTDLLKMLSTSTPNSGEINHHIRMISNFALTILIPNNHPNRQPLKPRKNPLPQQQTWLTGWELGRCPRIHKAQPHKTAPQIAQGDKCKKSYLSLF